ncbi:MAG: adenylosuccinate synthetase, partial [Anaerolineales bacterium]
LARVEPIYESLPGWQEPISQVRSIGDLPSAAWAYCQRMSELINVPIDLVSVGADRDELVALRWPL